MLIFRYGILRRGDIRCSFRTIEEAQANKVAGEHVVEMVFKLDSWSVVGGEE